MQERLLKQFFKVFLFPAMNNYKTEHIFPKPFFNKVTTNKTKREMKRAYN